MTGVMVSGRGRPNFKMAGILMNKKKFKACAPLGTDSFEIKMKKAKTVEKSPIHLAYFVYNYAVSWQGSL